MSISRTDSFCGNRSISFPGEEEPPLVFLGYFGAPNREGPLPLKERTIKLFKADIPTFLKEHKKEILIYLMILSLTILMAVFAPHISAVVGLSIIFSLCFLSISALLFVFEKEFEVLSRTKEWIFDRPSKNPEPVEMSTTKKGRSFSSPF